MGIQCYCNSCPDTHGIVNESCILQPHAMCYTSMTLGDDDVEILDYGCLPPESSLLQVSGKQIDVM